MIICNWWHSSKATSNDLIQYWINAMVMSNVQEQNIIGSILEIVRCDEI